MRRRLRWRKRGVRGVAETSLSVAGAFVVLAALWSSASLGTTVSGAARVIDGDTLEIGGTRVRLHGIDAPESAQRCRADGRSWPCGRYYGVTRIDVSKGERWFCSEVEARAAGWRRSRK